MKQWELRGVTVDRRGFPITTSPGPTVRQEVRSTAARPVPEESVASARDEVRESDR
jgi:hypothetical protein